MLVHVCVSCSKHVGVSLRFHTTQDITCPAHCTHTQPPDAERYYPPSFDGLMSKAGVKNRTAVKKEVQQIVRDVLNLDKQGGQKNVNKVVQYAKLERPGWWPSGVVWDSNWNKNGKGLQAVYEAAFARLREFAGDV